MLKVTLAGVASEVSPGVKIYEVLKDNKAIAARMNGTLVDLSTEINADCEVAPVYFDSPEGHTIFWHSTSHLMAQAVKQLFPDAKLAIGPSIDEGFYYDFDMAQTLSDQDLARIEAKMTELAKQEIPIRHRFVPRAELLAEYEKDGNTYKAELLAGIPEESNRQERQERQETQPRESNRQERQERQLGGLISVYEQAEFRDLCRGPHISNTKQIRAIKLLSVAGAYWRGDEKGKMLQRIYGVSFPTRPLLEEHLARLEEAKKRDHRKLGPALDLFSLHEEAGAGLVFWHPKGATVRRIIEQYWIDEHLAAGYQLVVTPHIARSGLWRTSGHYDFFRDNMFTLPVENEEYVLKPMNCPGHIIIYRSGVRSYRDLPYRLGEWGTVYRNERSGVLHGAMRVRGLTQDDAHIFCSEEQMQDEVFNVVQLSRKILGTFGFTEFAVDLSVRDPANKGHYMGADRDWELAEQSLTLALQKAGLAFTRAEGEAAFYGPKIDIKLFDSLGRQWQCPTIQFDFNEAERFNIYYMGRDGQHHRAYMVHRTILGSVERFMAILVEHYAGAFPVWLAPVQAIVLTVTEAQSAYAQGVFEKLRGAGVRAAVDVRNEKVGYKIGEAERDKIPYMLVIGNKEQESGTVALRKRSKGNLGPAALEAVINQLKEDDAIRRQTTA